MAKPKREFGSIFRVRARKDGKLLPNLYVSWTDAEGHRHQRVAGPTQKSAETRTGAKYHAAGCRYLSKSSIPIMLSEAKKTLSPCSVCNPPR